MNDGIKMTPQEIEAFHKELGKVCANYGIDGIAGVWFGRGEEMGDLIFWNVAKPQMKVFCAAICNKFREFGDKNGAKRGPNLGRVGGMAEPDADKN